MPAYDSANLYPPAPFALVSLRNRDTGASKTDVRMLIDTGADVTLIPEAAVGDLGVAADTGKRYELIGFDNSASFAQVVSLDLIFLGRTFHGQFLLIGQEWGILGRNVLNALPLLLDGPSLAWSEFKP